MGALAKAWRVMRAYGSPRGLHPIPTIDHHILIVDDDPYIRQTLADLLYEEGYTPIQAGNGQEALAALEARRDKPPALVILDLMMPVMTGQEFYTKQRADPEFSKIPVLVISAYRRNVSDIPEGVAFLDKPLSLDTLLPLVAHLTKSGAVL